MNLHEKLILERYAIIERNAETEVKRIRDQIEKPRNEYWRGMRAKGVNNDKIDRLYRRLGAAERKLTEAQERRKRYEQSLAQEAAREALGELPIPGVPVP